MSLPTEKHVEEWLHKLGETDEAYAQACASLTAAKERLKVAKMEGLPDEGTALEREKAAYTSRAYKDAIAALRDAEANKKLLELRREQWSLGIDVWRSLNANQRRTS